MDFIVEFACAVQVMTERFLDNDPAPAITAREPMLAKREDGFGIEAGLSGEIKENISGSLVAFLERIEFGADFVVRGGVPEITGNIEQRLGKGFPNVLVEGGVLEKFLDGL